MENRPKMSQADRAKQFMPFDALKGFRELLREKERVLVPKATLTEDKQAELDYKIHRIHNQDMVTIVYFEKDAYVKVTGIVTRIDPGSRILKVVNTKIPFDDIYEIIW